MHSSTSATLFSRELATYEVHRLDLERDHPGKIAILHGDELVGIFGDLTSAIEEAHRLFSQDDFIVQEIGDPVADRFMGVFSDWS